MLRDLQMLCDTDVRKILKLCSTRWLSLGQCVNRLLQQWEPLTLFFAEEVAGKKGAKPLTSSADRSLKSPGLIQTENRGRKDDRKNRGHKTAEAVCILD